MTVLDPTFHASLAEKTSEFHRVFDLALFTVPTEPDEDLKQLRFALFEEEFEEYNEALDAGDIVKIADALADMAYVAHGTAHAYGLAVPARGHVWSGRSIGDAFEVYIDAVHRGDLSVVAVAISDVLAAIDEASDRHGVPLPAVIDEVHRSNMSKLDENGRALYFPNGKVRKSSLFFEPDIAGVLERAA